MIPQTQPIKLKHAANFISRGVSPDYSEIDDGIKFINQACIYWESLKLEAVKYANPESNALQSKGLLYPGDVLLNSTGTGTLGRAVVFNQSDDKYVADSHVTIVRPNQNKVLTKFLYYIIRSNSFQDFIYTTCVSGSTNQIELSRERLRELTLDLPEIKTQERITEFLDQKITKIDEAIAKKKQLLQLLEEKRTAAINIIVRSVSGERKKIKHVATINPVTKTKFKYSEKVTFFPMEAVSEYGELFSQERALEDVISGYTYFEENDVVIAKITPCFENGKAAVMNNLKNGFGFGTTEFIVIRSSSKIIPEYLYYIIFSRHFRENGINEMRGTAGQKRVTEAYVSNYTFNLPGKVTQLRLANQLRDSLSNTDKVKSKISVSIELLEEYKTSLISYAVTGRVKI